MTTSNLMHDFFRRGADVGLNGVDGPCGVDHHNAIAVSRGFGEKTTPQSLAEFIALPLHPIQRSLNSVVGRSRRHIEQKCQIWQHAPRDIIADFPQFGHIQISSMTLVHHVREQVSIAHDRLSRNHCGLNHLLDQLGARRHVKQHLGHRADRQATVFQQNLPDRIA